MQVIPVDDNTYFHINKRVIFSYTQLKKLVPWGVTFLSTVFNPIGSSEMQRHSLTQRFCVASQVMLMEIATNEGLVKECDLRLGGATGGCLEVVFI